MAKSASRKENFWDRARVRGLSRARTTQTAESNYGLTLSVILDEQELHCVEVQGSGWQVCD